MKTISKVIPALLMLIMIVASSDTAMADPQMPHGVSGTVFQSDNITQVPRGTQFNVTNVDTGYNINGSTGGPPIPGYNGWFSVALPADDGDIVRVMSCIGQVCGSTTFQIYGDVSGVRVVLGTQQ